MVYKFRLKKVLKISISWRLFFYYGILGLSRIFENSAISSGKKKSPWIYIRCEMTRISQQECRGILEQWWDFMADIMETNSDNSPVCVDLRPVFHLD